MNKLIFLLVTVMAVTAAAFAQTPKFQYEIAKFAAPFPNATGNAGDTVSVAADGKGSILVLRRSDPPVLVYNRQGQLQHTWGTGLFVDTHNIDVDRFGFVWIGDRNGQILYKFTLDGKQLMSIGTKGVKGDDSSQTSFHRASDVFVAPNGDIFVADGYENHRIVRFSKDGKFINIIGGAAGRGAGQFSAIHGVQMDSKGRLIVLERHTNDPRIQVWDPSGKFIEEWSGLGLTYGSGFTKDEGDTFYIGDTEGHQLLIVSDGKIVDRMKWGLQAGGLQVEAHQVVWDSGTGAFYLADTGAPGGMIWRVAIKK